MLRRCLVLWASGTTRRPKRSFLVSSSSRRTDPHTRPPTEQSENATPVLPSKSGRKASLYAPVAGDNSTRHFSSPSSTRRNYDTLPEDMYEAPKSTRAAEQRTRLHKILYGSQTSVVDVTTGGELDIPQHQSSEDFNRENVLTIPEESSLYQSVVNASSLESRARYNTWDVAARRLSRTTERGHNNNKNNTATSPEDAGNPTTSQSSSHCEGSSGQVFSSATATPYRTTFREMPTLAPYVDAVAATRSTYALRKLHPVGVSTHPNVITEMEEVDIIREALRLTQSKSAAYIAEECRYCVNLFEEGLGVPTRDPLAFPLSSCTVLQQVFQRLYDLLLIPMLPNVVQISEFTNTFSGYPPHRKTHAVGTYLGLLNLVSTGILHMQHQQFTWAPRLSCAARTLVVVEPPSLYEYSIGYSQTHQPFHNFDYGARLSKDYRLEILFAAVPVQQSKLLRESVALTQAGRRRLRQLPAGTADPVTAVDAEVKKDNTGTRARPSSSWGADAALRALAASPHTPSSKALQPPPVSAAAAQSALAPLVGTSRRCGIPSPTGSTAAATAGTTSAAQADAKRRMDRLRARYEAATAAAAAKGDHGGNAIRTATRV